MSSINTNLSNAWDSIYKDKKFDKEDINALKSEILSDKNIDNEEISFLESKIGELTDINEKTELSNFVQSLKKEVSSNVEKIENTQNEILKISKQIDPLLKTGSKTDANKAIGLSKKLIDNIKTLQTLLKDENFGKEKAGLQKALIAAKLNLAVSNLLSGNIENSASILSIKGKKDSKYGISENEKSYLLENNETSQTLKNQFDRISKPVTKQLEQINKAKQEIKAIETSIQGLDKLIKENKTSDAIPKAQELIKELETKQPQSKELIAGLKLQLASLYMMNSSMKEVLRLIKEIKESSPNSEIKDRALFMEAQINLKTNKLSDAMKIFDKLIKSSDKEISSSAKEIKVSVEMSYVETVKKMADSNIKILNQAKEQKTPESAWALLNPVTSVKVIAGHYDNIQTIHDSNISELSDMSYASIRLQNVMKKTGKTLSEISTMSFSDLRKIKGVSNSDVVEIKNLLSNPDIKKVMDSKFDNKFTWETNKLYISADYLDTEFDVASKWVGEQVKTSREIDDSLMKSNSRLDRIVGYSSAFVLDSLSDANGFVKDSIKTAHEYYNAEDKNGSVLAWVGDKVTTGGDILSSTVTAPATLFDYKATDQERSDALQTTALIIGTMGILKAGTPAWKSLGANAVKLGASTSVVLPKVSQFLVSHTPNMVKVPIGSVIESKVTQSIIGKTSVLVDDLGTLGTKTSDFMTKERYIFKKPISDISKLETIQLAENTAQAFVNNAPQAMDKSQKLVNTLRDKLHDTPVIGKFVQSSDEIAFAARQVSLKIDNGFTDLIGRNSKALEAKGFVVPQNMEEFKLMVANNPTKAKDMITTSLLEETSVKNGLDKIVTEAKKGLSESQLSKFEANKAIQEYLVKNPEKFYDEFGGMLTENFAKGLSETEIKKAGLEYFTHYTNKESISKILSSGKILEQKWDIATGPIANLTDDIMTGKLINPLKIRERLTSILNETRTWGFRTSKPLGINDINFMDKTVSSLNTSKAPEAVINVLVPKSRIGSPKDWKRINDILPNTQSLGTMRNGVELFPKQLSESIISQSDKQALIKGIRYQGTVPSEIINAIILSLEVGNVALGSQIEWDDVFNMLEQQIDKAMPKK